MISTHMPTFVSTFPASCFHLNCTLAIRLDIRDDNIHMRNSFRRQSSNPAMTQKLAEDIVLSCGTCECGLRGHVREGLAQEAKFLFRSSGRSNAHENDVYTALSEAQPSEGIFSCALNLVANNFLFPVLSNTSKANS